MAEVLGSACSGASGASRLSPLPGLLGYLQHSQEETPSIRLGAVKDHLATLSQVRFLSHDTPLKAFCISEYD